VHGQSLIDDRGDGCSPRYRSVVLQIVYVEGVHVESIYDSAKGTDVEAIGLD
jgi:hypothetical protein